MRHINPFRPITSRAQRSACIHRRNNPSVLKFLVLPVTYKNGTCFRRPILEVMPHPSKFNHPLSPFLLTLQSRALRLRLRLRWTRSKLSAPYLYVTPQPSQPLASACLPSKWRISSGRLAAILTPSCARLPVVHSLDGWYSSAVIVGLVAASLHQNSSSAVSISPPACSPISFLPHEL